MPEIIDYMTCESCGGEGEVKNHSFLALDPLKRLEMVNDPNFDLNMQDMAQPTIKCPFCEDGQAPIYECDECNGTGDNKENPERPGCPKCDNAGWYI